jgi:ABC-type uncharacterized transport system substrate-binding protein
MKVVRNQWSVVSKSVFCFALSALLFASYSPAEAQQGGKRTLRIGYLGNSASTEARDLKRFRERLSELGYNDNQNVTIEEKYWEGKVERLPEIATDLVRLNCDVIVTAGTADVTVKAIQNLADVLVLEIQSLEIKRAEDFEVSFQAATQKRAQAMLMGTGGFFAYHQRRIIELASKSRLPAMHTNIRFVEAGGLMTYAYDRPYQYRRAAEYVDKILKGARPSDLPLERPKKFELAINLKTAKQIGLTIPPNVLARADRVVR